MTENIAPISPEKPDANAHVWSRMAGSVAAQHWPSATLYVVATPIGNLGDLSVRAWYALAHAEAIAAEDTRVTRKLLDAWGLATPMIAAHRHNEASAAADIVARLAQGARIALVSDAGAPAISDPGTRIVQAVRSAGYRVVPVPGASAVITALMASGVTTDANPAYVFAGFAPSKAGARQRWLRQWVALPAPVVLFESPHRLAALLRDVSAVCAADRLLTLARELTKRFEAITTLPISQAEAWLAADPQRGQGECVLIVHEAPEHAAAGEAADGENRAALEAWLDALLASVSVRDAARIAAQATGAPRAALYARALARKAASRPG